MKIKDVELITGLTQRAIRLYESKGLLNVSRSSNAYRDYSGETVEKLKLIKLLRQAGVGLPDIRLWNDGVISADELLRKRKRELCRENNVFSQQSMLCDRLIAYVQDGMRPGEWPEDSGRVDEAGAAQEDLSGMALSLGIDIGTTTISAVVLNLTARTQADAYTLLNDSQVDTGEDYRREQDAELLAGKVERLVASILKSYPSIGSIGFTGQMHGIVYIDRQGRAVSNLITWQDERANQPAPSGQTYCREMEERTGRPVAAGYGLATHYTNLKTGLVPCEAVTLCTIMDYAVMRLTGRAKPLIHASNAASFGFYDAGRGGFDTAALAALGVDAAFLPEVTGDCAAAGQFQGIPVTVALGDNQASFLGSVRDEEKSVLVNYGTGSQVSMVTRHTAHEAPLELRPYTQGRYLLSGSALCGGRAYALLERFFRAYIEACGGEAKSQYEVMNRLAEEARRTGATLRVKTTFCGTRQEPSLRGGMADIGEENFTPGQMIAGVLNGMAEELYDMYRAAGRGGAQILVASGNAVQKNPVLREILSEKFGMALKIPRFKEEAALGAALFSALAAGQIACMEEGKACIAYEGE